MALNVGGIYVKTNDQARVVEAIKKHWLAVGARPLDASCDPLSLQPLSVQKTSKLGYAVCPPGEDQDGAMWIAVYDSERYHGSYELARVLADELDTAVVIWSFSGSVDMARLYTYGPASKTAGFKLRKSTDWGEIESAIGSMPLPFVYFNQLKDAEEPLEGFAFFGFEGMPFRDDEYRGPSKEERRALDLVEAVKGHVAAGDLAAVRAAYDANPNQAYPILSAVSDGVSVYGDAPVKALADGNASGAWHVVLGMGDEMLTDPSLYWRTERVGIGAFLTGDRDLFDRACKVMGTRVSAFEGVAVALIHVKRHGEAIELLRRVTEVEGASLTSFNNLAHALCGAPEVPADARALLDRCEAHGKANSYVFHNTACAWLRLGDRERALAAVRGAVDVGYPLLEQMRTDADLAPLRDDPRFAEAFEAPAATSLADLVVEKQYRGKSYVLQRPIFAFDFFLEPLGSHRVGPAIAAALEAYLADIPPSALTSVRRNGPWKKLVKSALTRDLNKLRNAEASSFVSIDWRGDTDESGGAPTDYGVHVTVWGDSADFGPHEHVPHVTVWFPAALYEGDVDAMAARYARYAAMMPVDAGGAGLRVELRKSDYVETWWESDMLQQQLARFAGSESHPWRDWNAGRAAGAMWLSFLSHALAAELGGARELRERTAPAQVEELPGGLLLRASLRPGIGLGKPPRDLGALPLVAKALEPLMLSHDQPHTQEKIEAHYRRLYDVTVTDYENGPPVVPDPTLLPPAAAAPKPAKKRARRTKGD